MAVSMVLGAIVSIQLGAAVATELFSDIGAAGVVFARGAISAVILTLIFRPKYRVPKGQRKSTFLYGVALAAMFLCFYESIDRIPLGTAVTLEFIGPLGVAVITSRKRRDLIWVALAAAGILILGGGVGGDDLDPVGVVLALLAGLSWGWYILLGKKVGQESKGTGNLAVALAISAVITAPFGIYSGGTELFDPRVLAICLLVAILSSAIPLSLELEAMRRLPSNVFGVMLSIEPAVAATIGFVVLSQAIVPAQMLAILLVISASAGALWSSKAPPPIEP
ncbi:MAG: EamA family transporter [Solirubrobacterales bacterium]